MSDSPITILASEYKAMADRIVTLAAELARYEQKDRAKTRVINILVPENRALAAENERLSKDAERWRCLSSQMFYEVRLHVEHIAGVNGPRYRRFYHDSTYTTATSIQEAIDAALAKEPTT